MKIYIASSWKNEFLVKVLSDLLRDWGHEADCFADESTGRYAFHVSEVGPFGEIDAIDFLEDERAQRAFAEDKKWLDWCECVVLVLPAGKSSHLEAGYAKGQGKHLFILGEFPNGEFDVMYGFADGLFRKPDQLRTALEQIEQGRRSKA